MKKGDNWNWALAISSIMMLFMASTFVTFTLGDSFDKYRVAFVLMVLNFLLTVICLGAPGLLSLFGRRPEPIMGAIYGFALFYGMGVVLFMILFFLSGILSLFHLSRPIVSCVMKTTGSCLFFGLPLFSLGFAFFRHPREPKSKQGSPPPLPPHKQDPRGGDISVQNDDHNL